MRTRTAILLCCAMLAGCATTERFNESELSPGPEAGTWTFRANATLGYPEASPEAEHTRMEWLHTWMSEAQACPGGYTVTDRQAVQRGTLLGQPFHRVYYLVRCT